MECLSLFIIASPFVTFTLSCVHLLNNFYGPLEESAETILKTLKLISVAETSILN